MNFKSKYFTVPEKVLLPPMYQLLDVQPGVVWSGCQYCQPSTRITASYQSNSCQKFNAPRRDESLKISEIEEECEKNEKTDSGVFMEHVVNGKISVSISSW